MNKLEHRYTRYQTTSIEVIATEIAKSFIESGCTDDCIPEYSVEMDIIQVAIFVSLFVCVLILFRRDT